MKLLGILVFGLFFSMNVIAEDLGNNNSNQPRSDGRVEYVQSMNGSSQAKQELISFLKKVESMRQGLSDEAKKMLHQANQYAMSKNSGKERRGGGSSRGQNREQNIPVGQEVVN